MAADPETFPMPPANASPADSKAAGSLARPFVLIPDGRIGHWPPFGTRP